jgi:hypothetical protein
MIKAFPMYFFDIAQIPDQGRDDIGVRTPASDRDERLQAVR